VEFRKPFCVVPRKPLILRGRRSLYLGFRNQMFCECSGSVDLKSESAFVVWLIVRRHSRARHFPPPETSLPETQAPRGHRESKKVRHGPTKSMTLQVA